MRFVEHEEERSPPTFIKFLDESPDWKKESEDSDVPAIVEEDNNLLKEKLNQMFVENKMLKRKVIELNHECRELRSSNSFSKRQKIGEEGSIFSGSNSSEICSGNEEPSITEKAKGIVMNKIARFYYPIDESDTSLAVKDGFQWKKYGQKVTKDNPSPRAYFKCALAPSCPAKKKVQRSAQNPDLLEATYLGEHNHSETRPPVLSPAAFPPSVSQVVRQSVTHLDPTVAAVLLEAVTGKYQNQIRV